LSVYSKLIGL